MGITKNKTILTVMQAKGLASSFVNSQFNYCAILQMICSRIQKFRLENIYQRTFLRTMMKLVFIRNIYSFQRLKSLNRQTLNPQFMSCFFENHEIPCNLRCESVVKLPGTNTTKYGIKALNFRGAVLWNIIPKNVKLSKTLPGFKRRLKKQLIPCNCAACRFSIIGYTLIQIIVQ